MIDTRTEIRIEEDWKIVSEKSEQYFKLLMILLNEVIERWKDSRNYGKTRNKVIEDQQEKLDIFLEDMLKWVIVFLKKGIYIRMHFLDEIQNWL